MVHDALHRVGGAAERSQRLREQQQLRCLHVGKALLRLQGHHLEELAGPGSAAAGKAHLDDLHDGEPGQLRPQKHLRLPEEFVLGLLRDGGALGLCHCEQQADKVRQREPAEGHRRRLSHARQDGVDELRLCSGDGEVHEAVRRDLQGERRPRGKHANGRRELSGGVALVGQVGDAGGEVAQVHGGGALGQQLQAALLQSARL
mmetsp:Transcript_14465/g.39676  ORF Transcript_14465/g.39676 Transcript_14465/m.39676 type:complete len:203 (+) Transcript_14465:725-1333(+)